MGTRVKPDQKVHRATAFTTTKALRKRNDGRCDLVVWTDEGDEVPILVERYQLRGLIAAAAAALDDEEDTY